MLVKATGAVANFNRLVSKNQARLIFYGTSLPAIRTWLHINSTQKIAYEGTVHVYEGRYEKTNHGKSEMYDSMSVRHQGWGKGTIGTPGVSGAIKLGMKGTGAIQIRYFIALVHDSAVHGNAAITSPKIMHHQKMCNHRQTWATANVYTKGGLTFANVRS